MSKRLALRALSTGLFALPILVLSITFLSARSVEAGEGCPDCHSTTLTCDGSPCACRSTQTAGYKCLPPL